MPEAFVLETRDPGARSGCSQASLGFCKRFLNALVLQDRLGGHTPSWVSSSFGMASLIGGSNLRHKNPESHLLVRSLVPTQEKVLTAASQSGVEDAAQRSSDLQLRA